MKRLTLFFFSAFTATALLAQTHPVVDQHHHHHHERNEIGISTGAMYALDHEEWGAGFHLHYLRTLGDHSRWAVGAFAEYAWIKEAHYAFGVGFNYEIVDKLHFGLFPGIVVAKHEEHEDHDSHGHTGHSHRHDKTQTRFSIHGELVYDLFTWKNFHLGPALDYSWSDQDSHMMLGIHAAYCF